MNFLRLQQFEIDMLTIKYFMLFLYQHIRCITVELNLNIHHRYIPTTDWFYCHLPNYTSETNEKGTFEV